MLQLYTSKYFYVHKKGVKKIKHKTKNKNFIYNSITKKGKGVFLHLPPTTRVLYMRSIQM